MSGERDFLLRENQESIGLTQLGISGEDDQRALGGEVESRSGSGNKWAVGGLLALCSVFISVSLTVHVTSQVSTISNAMNSAVMLIGIMIVIAFHVKSLRNLRMRNDLSVKDVIQHHVTVIPIIGFYAVLLILDYFSIVADISCRDVWRECGHIVDNIFKSNLTFTILRILFVSSVTLFCRNFYNANFDSNSVSVRVGLVILASANVSIWFDALSHEVSDRIDGGADNLTHLCQTPRFNETRAYSCLHRNTDEFKSLKTVRFYIYPITIEYFLLVCEFLFENFLHFKNADNPTVMNSHQPTALNNNNAYFLSDEPTVDHSEVGLKIYLSRGAANILFPAASVLFCALAFFDSKLLNNRDKPQHRDIFYIYSSIYYAAMTVAVIVCFASSRQFRTRRKKVTGFECLVILSAAGIIIDNVFRTVAIYRLTKCDYWSPSNNTCDVRINSRAHLTVGPSLYVITDAFDTVQVFVQIPFLVYCQKLIKPQQRNSQLVMVFQAMLSFLIMSNFANWVVNSILFSGVSPTYVYFDDVISIWVMNVILPFEVFFRITSTFLFLQVFLRD